MVGHILFEYKEYPKQDIMLAQESDKMLGQRLETLEKGVHVLDDRVKSLDDKVTHVIQMNSELMIQSNENFREMRGQLDAHRTELKKSISKLKEYKTSFLLPL